MGEGSRVVKRVSSGFRERLRKSQITGKFRGAPQRPLGSQGFLVVLEGESLEKILTHPAWGPARVEVSQVVAHLLDEFHLLIQEVFLQEVTEVRVCMGRTQGMQIPKALVQVLLQGQGGSHGVLSFISLIMGRLRHVLEENVATALVLQL